MGNRNINQQDSSQILCDYWEPIGPTLFRNKATQQIIKQKKISFRSEDQMKYIFNCLIKRMNNYNSNVIKIIYLRKIIQTNSLCQCGKKFVILVYLENVENKLQNFVKQRQILSDKHNLSTNDRIFYDNKCICLHILKGLDYLKEKYGFFKVSQKNIWVEFPKISSLNSVNQQKNKLSVANKQFQHTNRNLKVKTWISSEQEQNYPDQCCEQKQMCQSVIHLIQRSLIPYKLCKEYSSQQSLNSLKNIFKFNELRQKIIKYHEIKQNHQDPYLGNNYIHHCIKPENEIPQRAVRAFSSNQQVHISSHNQINKWGYQHQKDNYRKYSSIQYVRKPANTVYFNTNEKKPLKILFAGTGSMNEESVNLLKQRNKQTSIKCNNTVKYDKPSLNIIQKVIQKHTNENIANIQAYKGGHFFNPKIKYRQGNNLLSKPIDGITHQNYPQEKHSSFFSDYNKPSQILNFNHNESSDRNKTQNKYSQDQSISVARAFVNSQVKKHQVAQSYKPSFPTDRTTKIDLSLKDQQKKQASAINSSRKNISIKPISLDSTYGATSSLKPAGMHNILKQQQQINEQIEGGVLDSNYPKDVQEIFKNSKKQSNSSSKSQKGHYSSSQANNNKQIQIQKLLVKKRMSNHCEHSFLGSMDILEQSIERQKSQSFSNKPLLIQIQNIAKELEKLRQNECIAVTKNSLIIQKLQLIRQPKQLPQKLQLPNKLTSLTEMEARFITRQYIDDNNENQRCSQISQQIAQTEKLKEKLSQKVVSERISKNQIQEKIINQQNFVQENICNPEGYIQSLKRIQSAQKVSSFIVRQTEEPTQYIIYDDCKIKIKQSNESLTHKKKLSAQIPDKTQARMAKNMSLKLQFKTLLDYPKETSLKAFTQDKQIKSSLNQQSGRQTYSIYNESEYNSQNRSKKPSQADVVIPDSPPLPHRSSKYFKKPLSKAELQKKINEKKDKLKIEAQTILRLTSSGHQDNSIKQKVRNKKAQFAELKNQMNNLLL